LRECFDGCSFEDWKTFAKNSAYRTHSRGANEHPVRPFRHCFPLFQFAYQNLEASSSGSKVLDAVVELNLVSLTRGHAAAEASPFVKQCNRDPGIS
jgi:hypothetical protein